MEEDSQVISRGTSVKSKKIFGIKFVALTEFHIKDGLRIEFKYPENESLEPDLSDQFLANSSIPDGAHFHQTDQSYLILPIKNKNNKIKKYYGISFCRNKADKSVKRGAIQKSLLLVSKYPHFHIFEQAAYELLESLIDSQENAFELLIKFYNQFVDEKNLQVISGIDKSYYRTDISIFTHVYHINVPLSYPPDHFDSVSLLTLLLTFRVFLFFPLLPSPSFFSFLPSHSTLLP